MISTNIHHGNDLEEYNRLIDETFEEANKVAGYLGMESAHEPYGDDGQIYTVAAIYFTTLESLNQWRDNRKHTQVKTGAKKRWFVEHNIRICQVLEQYGHNLSHS